MVNFKELSEEVSRRDPAEILSVLGIPHKQKNLRSYVLNIRGEKTPSAYITDMGSGKWFYKDFGSGSGGNIYNVVMDYKNIDFKEASRLVNDVLGISSSNHQVNKRLEELKKERKDLEATKKEQKQPSSKVSKENSLNYRAIEYFRKRGIKNISPFFSVIQGEALDLSSSKTNKQISKKYFGIGLMNESGGANIHFLKPLGNLKSINLGSGDISIIGKNKSYISIFESKMDYASAYDAGCAYGKSIIAHSVVNTKKIQEYLRTHKPKKIFLYPQNDIPGKEFAQKIIQTARELKIEVISFCYRKSEIDKDLNDLHKNQIDLKKRLKIVKEHTNEQNRNF